MLSTKAISLCGNWTFPCAFFDDSDLYSSLTPQPFITNALPHSRRRETLTQRHSVTSRGPEIWFLLNRGCLQQMRWQTSFVQAPNISPTKVSSLNDQLNTNSLSDSSNSVVWTGQRFQPTQQIALRYAHSVLGCITVTKAQFRLCFVCRNAITQLVTKYLAPRMFPPSVGLLLGWLIGWLTHSFATEVWGPLVFAKRFIQRYVSQRHTSESQNRRALHIGDSRTEIY
jgi:hypothetical protein